jgi:methylmalonyl-CoA mutase C-terminal domain/subunit
MTRKIRVLVGKPGLDGHDRGAKVVAAALRDAGMEVIYTGLHQSPEQIVEAALQEDVDVVALSILSGAHMTLFPEVLGLMKERGIGDRLLTGGGIIPPEDMESLARMGVGRLFGPGTSTQDIAGYIREWFVTQTGEEPLIPPKPTVRTRTVAMASPVKRARPKMNGRPAKAARPKAVKAGARSAKASKPTKKRAARTARKKARR